MYHCITYYVLLSMFQYANIPLNERNLKIIFKVHIQMFGGNERMNEVEKNAVTSVPATDLYENRKPYFRTIMRR